MPSPSPENSEWLTRKKIIDRKLRASGWRITPFNPVQPLSKLDSCAIEEFETATGPADYALCLNGQIAAVVEAKKLSLGPQNVLSQAERYSRGLIRKGSTQANSAPRFSTPPTARSSGTTISVMRVIAPGRSPDSTPPPPSLNS